VIFIDFNDSDAVVIVTFFDEKQLKNTLHSHIRLQASLYKYIKDDCMVGCWVQAL
jgi:hypothetical protein